METTIAEQVIERFNDRTESGQEPLSQQEIENLASEFNSLTDLTEALPDLYEEVERQKTCIQNADERKKRADADKKFWQGRMEAFLKILEAAANKHGKTKLNGEGITLSVSKRTSLEVNEEWLLSGYQSITEAFQKTLPPYVKVKLSVDKNELSAFLKDDNTMLLNSPEEIHTKVSTSTTLKSKDDPRKKSAK